MRLFFDLVDFSDARCDSLRMMWAFADHHICQFPKKESSLDMFEWLVKRFSAEVKHQMSPEDHMEILTYLAGASHPLALTLWVEYGPKEAINTLNDDGLNSLLRHMFYQDGMLAELLVPILICGADPNCVGLNLKESPWPESPTSLSMYNSYSFEAWRHALQRTNTNAVGLEKGFAEDSNNFPLLEAGWTRKTFQKLLGWNHSDEPFSDRYMEPYCEICEIRFYGFYIQPVWLYSLEEIKSGVLPDDTIWRVFDWREGRSGSETQASISSVSLQQFDDDTGPSCESYKSKGRIGEQQYRMFEGASGIMRSLERTYLREVENWKFSFPKVWHPCEFHTNRMVRDFLSDSAGSELTTLTFPFVREDVLCMDCWIRYLRFQSRGFDIASDDLFNDPDSDSDWNTVSDDGEFSDDPDSTSTSASDESSGDEFSPFLIHS